VSNATCDRAQCGLARTSLFSYSAAAQSTTPTAPTAASSDDDATALAKKLQNPIGDLYSFPFQNNTNFNTGPHKGTQDILNVQPVIPIHINPDWTVITRTILPLTHLIRLHTRDLLADVV